MSPEDLIDRIIALLLELKGAIDSDDADIGEDDAEDFEV